MSEFKPLFSPQEAGEFKPSPATDQYALEQEAARDPESYSSFESSKLPGSKDIAPSPASDLPPEDEVVSPPELPLPDEVSAEAANEATEEPAQLPQAIDEMLEKARLEGVEQGRQEAP